MLHNVNNIDLPALEQTLSRARQDLAMLRRTQAVEGEWLFDPAAGAQFRAEVPYGSGKTVLESDLPPILGGGGRAPEPMQYFFYGLAACYAAAYAGLATTQGIGLRKLVVKVEAKQDYSRAVGLSGDPFVAGLTVTLTVRGDAPKQKLEEIESQVRQRCPGISDVASAMPLETALLVEEQASKADIMSTLRHVYDPDYFDRSIVDMGLVTEDDVQIEGNDVKVSYRLSAPICPFSAAIGLMIKHALENKLGVNAEARLKPGHYQEELVNELLSDEQKSAELLDKMESYGVLQRCIRW